ncbi:MAG TPA: hypothetical protein VHR47_03310 [Bacillota bacterium]|nr:hypothetical protein [Bacillota bacterium]
MSQLLVTMLIGFFVGIIGTGIGGLMVLALPSQSVKKQSLLLGGSGGIMIAVVIWDLWPEASHLHRLSAVGGLLTGALFVLLAGLLMKMKSKGFINRFTRTGILMGMGIGMHNFPEGLAVGTVRTVADKWQEWAGLAGLMAAHNVPEGMVVAATLRLGKVRVQKVLLALLLVELPMGIGALFGGIIGQFSHRFVASALGFAAGAMALLVGKEMIPMGNELSSGKMTWAGFLLGIGVGFVLTRVIR